MYSEEYFRGCKTDTYHSFFEKTPPHLARIGFATTLLLQVPSPTTELPDPMDTEQKKAQQQQMAHPLTLVTQEAFKSISKA